ncbi:MAG: type II secretion system protein [Acidobacteriota bacterium]
MRLNASTPAVEGGGTQVPQPAPRLALFRNIVSRGWGLGAGSGSRPPKKRCAGFTLLEVLVATAIMGIAIAGVMSGLAQASRNTARLTQYDRATILARQKMDELLVDDSIIRRRPIQGRFPPAQAGGLDAGWRAQVAPFESLTPEIGAGMSVVDRIELEIWWMDGTTRRSFSLDGFRRSQMRTEDF